jgi:hypothetical protein
LINFSPQISVEKMWGSRGNDADTLLEKSFEVIHSRVSKRFFRRVAEISTEHLSPKIQSGIHSEHFSTYPQRSSQQQALYIFVLLKIFVMTVVVVKKHSPKISKQRHWLNNEFLSRVPISTGLSRVQPFILSRKTSTVR